MNLQRGHRKGLSYSGAPATYMTRPSSSSEALMYTVLEAATSDVRFMNKSARRWEIPYSLVRCNMSKPTQVTVFSLAVLLHDNGTPETEHSMKKDMSAYL